MSESDSSRLTVAVVAREVEPPLRTLIERASDVEYLLGPDETALGPGLERAEALFLYDYASTVVRRLLLLMPRLRWAHVGAAGVDAICSPELVGSEVVLTNSRGLFSEAVAEFAITLVAAHAKLLHLFLDQQRRRVWQVQLIQDLAGATVGVIGLGDIGRQVVGKARGLGMRSLGLRSQPAADDPDVERVYGPDGLAELLAASDYVVIAAPLTDRTRGLIGAAQLALMKPDAVLINVGRGGIVDETALDRALREGRLRGAALDVFAREPLPQDSPLWDAPNCYVTPHLAGDFPGWKERTVDFFLDNLERFRRGEPLLNVVDKRRGY